jgi:hypothetical protein
VCPFANLPRLSFAALRNDADVVTLVAGIEKILESLLGLSRVVIYANHCFRHLTFPFPQSASRAACKRHDDEQNYDDNEKRNQPLASAPALRPIEDPDAFS